MSYIFESKRLGFRLWLERDYELFSKMNQKETVMRYFDHPLTKEESYALIDRIINHYNEKGYTVWAIEIKETKEFIGFIGLYTAHFESDFTPCVEIGWRLDDQFWNKGYATEGAKEVLKYGTEILGIHDIYSFTSEINLPSIRVMEKIGLKKVKFFEHPNFEENHPLRPHVLYKY